MDRDEASSVLRVKGPEKWYHRFEVIDGVFTEGVLETNVTHMLRQLDMDPDELSGKRLLDVGTFNGGWAFGFEALGAEVVTIDIHDPANMGITVVKEIRDSEVTSFQMSIYDIDADRLGTFDYIFYSGVFYHLKHPLLALENINKVARQGAIVFGHGTSCDTWISDDDKAMLNLQQCYPEVNEYPMAHFVRDRYNNSTNNWFIPNAKGYEAWLKRTGFRVLKLEVKSQEHTIPQTSQVVMRSNLFYKAEKIAEPDKEYEVLDEAYYRPRGAKGRWVEDTWVNDSEE